VTTQTEQVDVSSMIAPGQESLLEEFLAEANGEAPAEDEGDSPLDQFLAQQEQGDQGDQSDDIPEKFRGKSPAEIVRAYQELERKLGAQAQQQPPAPAPAYERGRSIEEYGEALTDRFEAAQINPWEMAAAVQAGQDVSGYVEKLSATGLPRPLIETYLAAVTPQQQAPQSRLTPADEAELKAVVGGDQEFSRISQWAVANLAAEELADYNAVVDSGDKTAIRLALRSIKARSAAVKTTGDTEPKLITGGKPSNGMQVFESDEEAMLALNAKLPDGRVRYNVDPKYRKQVEAALARSNVFL
jgi:hypothetical protein